MPNKKLVKAVEIFFLLCQMLGFSMIVVWTYVHATNLYIDSCKKVQKAVFNR